MHHAASSNVGALNVQIRDKFETFGFVDFTEALIKKTTPKCCVSGLPVGLLWFLSWFIFVNENCKLSTVKCIMFDPIGLKTIWFNAVLSSIPYHQVFNHFESFLQSLIHQIARRMSIECIKKLNIRWKVRFYTFHSLDNINIIIIWDAYCSECSIQQYITCSPGVTQFKHHFNEDHWTNPCVNSWMKNKEQQQQQQQWNIV